MTDVCGVQISARVNEVNRNQIWREHVGKEVKKFVPGKTFQCLDPSRVAMVTVKPPMAQRMPAPPMPTLPRLPPLSPRSGASRRPASQSARSATVADEASTQQFMATFKGRTTLVPTERYKRPMTSSQSVGWDSWRPLTPRNPRFMANRRMCPETVYANTYVKMAGYGPYARTKVTVAHA